jgi:acetyltransferase
VLVIKVYLSVIAVPKPVDFAVAVTPARTVSDVIGTCDDHGVRRRFTLLAGFKETDTAGAALEH